MKTLNTIAILAMVAIPMVMGAKIASAQDATFNYSYVEGAYVHNNFKANGLTITDYTGYGNQDDDNVGTLSDSTGNGGNAKISFAIPTDNEKMGFHMVGEYTYTKHTSGLAIENNLGDTFAGQTGVGLGEFRISAGVHTMLSEKVSAFLELGMVSSKLSFMDTIVDGTSADVSSANASRTAFDARIGFRAMASERFEINGHVRYNGNGKFINLPNNIASFDGSVSVTAGGMFHMNDKFGFGADYEFGKPGKLRLLARVKF